MEERRLHKPIRVWFENGYGASIIPEWGRTDRWEIAVIKKPEGHICYETPVTDDVVRNLDRVGVMNTMQDIYELEAFDYE